MLGFVGVALASGISEFRFSKAIALVLDDIGIDVDSDSLAIFMFDQERADAIAIINDRSAEIARHGLVGVALAAQIRPGFALDFRG